MQRSRSAAPLVLCPLTDIHSPYFGICVCIIGILTCITQQDPKYLVSERMRDFQATFVVILRDLIVLLLRFDHHVLE